VNSGETLTTSTGSISFDQKNLDPRITEKATPATNIRSLEGVLNEILYQRRRELRVIFQYFDVENRGVLGTEDVVEGVQSLCDVLKVHVPRERIRRYAEKLAPDGKEIDYESFMSAFSAESKRIKGLYESAGQNGSDVSSDEDSAKNKVKVAPKPHRAVTTKPLEPDENEQFRNLKEFF